MRWTNLLDAQHVTWSSDVPPSCCRIEVYQRPDTEKVDVVVTLPRSVALDPATINAVQRSVWAHLDGRFARLAIKHPHSEPPHMWASATALARRFGPRPVGLDTAPDRGDHSAPTWLEPGDCVPPADYGARGTVQQCGAAPRVVLSDDFLAAVVDNGCFDDPAVLGATTSTRRVTDGRETVSTGLGSPDQPGWNTTPVTFTDGRTPASVTCMARVGGTFIAVVPFAGARGTASPMPTISPASVPSNTPSATPSPLPTHPDPIGDDAASILPEQAGTDPTMTVKPDEPGGSSLEVLAPCEDGALTLTTRPEGDGVGLSAALQGVTESKWMGYDWITPYVAWSHDPNLVDYTAVHGDLTFAATNTSGPDALSHRRHTWPQWAGMELVNRSGRKYLFCDASGYLSATRVFASTAVGLRPRKDMGLEIRRDTGVTWVTGEVLPKGGSWKVTATAWTPAGVERQTKVVDAYSSPATGHTFYAEFAGLAHVGAFTKVTITATDSDGRNRRWITVARSP